MDINEKSVVSFIFASCPRENLLCFKEFTREYYHDLYKPLLLYHAAAR